VADTYELVMLRPIPLPSSRQCLSYDEECLKDKRKDYQNCSAVLCATVVHSDIDAFMSSS